MGRLTNFEFDWCDFCKYYDDHSIDGFMACDSCNQQYDEEPSNFREKASVTAYREAYSATAEM